MPPGPPEAMPNPHIVRRLRKRFCAFAHILRTPEYHIAYGLWIEGQVATMPPEPDPADLTVSKRAWEASIQAWRHELRHIARQYTPRRF